MQLITGYAAFANGGYKVNPFFMQRIVDVDEGDKILYQAKPATACKDCSAAQVISPQNAYLISSVLKDVIQHGTGRAARVLKRRDLAGKTGTTNNQVDAWFTGFDTRVATTVWIGFDQPRSLYEYGAQAALPIWIQFMREALAGQPAHNMTQPPGIITTRIDPTTGLLAYPGEKGAIFEVFRQAHAPKRHAQNPLTHDDDLYSNDDNSDARLF